jgi:hypothetical protein
MNPLEEIDRGQAVPIPRGEARRAPRVSRRVCIQIALKHQGEDFVYNVNTVNFSRTGLRVIGRLPLEPGQPVIAFPNKGNIPSGYCRVIWTNGSETGLAYVN